MTCTPEIGCYASIKVAWPLSAQEPNIATVLQYVLESPILWQFCSRCSRVRYCDSFTVCGLGSGRDASSSVLHDPNIYQLCSINSHESSGKRPRAKKVDSASRQNSCDLSEPINNQLPLSTPLPNRPLLPSASHQKSYVINNQLPLATKSASFHSSCGRVDYWLLA